MDKLQEYYAALDAVRDTIADGGGTFAADSLTASERADGFAVGLVKGTAVKLTGDITEVDIADGIRRVKAAHPTAPYIGTWIDNGSVYIDPVVILSNGADAVTLGRALGQLAVWDIRLGRSIEL